MGIDPNFRGARQLRRQDAKRDARGPSREEQAQRAASDRQQNAFGEQLANQAAAAGAQGGANRKFSRASRGARQQEIRDIDARDQQHESDRAEQQHQERLHVSEAPS